MSPSAGKRITSTKRTASDENGTMKINKKIVLSFQAHEKEITRLQQEIDIAREQKDIAIKRVK